MLPWDRLPTDAWLRGYETTAPVLPSVGTDSTIKKCTRISQIISKISVIREL
jgi:hypothetical protein